MPLIVTYLIFCPRFFVHETSRIHTNYKFSSRKSAKKRKVNFQQLSTINFIWAFRLRRRAFRYIFFRYAPKGCRSNP